MTKRYLVVDQDNKTRWYGEDASYARDWFLDVVNGALFEDGVWKVIKAENDGQGTSSILEVLAPGAKTRSGESWYQVWNVDDGLVYHGQNGKKASVTPGELYRDGVLLSPGKLRVQAKNEDQEVRL